MDLITLRAGDASAVLAPAIGGAVVRYSSRRDGTTIEWLRPTSAEALLRADPYDTAGFPLVPYSNRIREGRFVFQERAVVLPRNCLPERHLAAGGRIDVGFLALDPGQSLCATVTLTPERLG